MYIIRDSELAAIKAEFHRIERRSEPVMARLGRKITERWRARASRRIAQTVMATQHTGVIADFTATRGGN